MWQKGKYKWLCLLFLSLLLQLGCLTNEIIHDSSYQRNATRCIVVMPFESSNPYLSGFYFSDYFTSEMIRKIQGINVVERKDLLKILREQRLSLSGVIQTEKISKLGAILGADTLLLGSVQTTETIQNNKGSIAVTVKVLDVPTGKILWVDRQIISYSAWYERGIPEVAEILMRKTGMKMVDRMEKNLVLRVSNE